MFFTEDGIDMNQPNWETIGDEDEGIHGHAHGHGHGHGDEEEEETEHDHDHHDHDHSHEWAWLKLIKEIIWSVWNTAGQIILLQDQTLN